MAFSINSTAFSNGAGIPREYTCQGRNVSPQLVWEGLPAGTQSLVLVCDDPDAPAGTWVHWVIYNIPATVSSLKQGMPASARLAEGMAQGKNDFGSLGWGGPCPPPGRPHRYFFKLYALDKVLAAHPGLTKKQILSLIQPNILAKAEMYGIYQRV
jgi:Raf kinase inhibitor-like YbhB/YbcL family protein